MDFSPLPTSSLVGAFLLAFPALFSIVNPVGASLIFDQAMGGRTRSERLRLARLIGFYAFLVLLGSLLLGGYILNFFGVSLGALRVAGGLVVAIRAWGLLMDPQEHEDRKTSQTEPAQRHEAKGQEDVAFFPLTMPFTTGPGSISVAIALSSQRPTEGDAVAPFFIGASLAAAAVAILVWLLYSASGRVMRLLGQGGARVLSRLVAFLLLCIGVQIIASGAENLVARFLTAHHG
jgi:multiple antibiotic resistance protein